MIRVGVIGYGYWGPNIVQESARTGFHAASKPSATKALRRLLGYRKSYPGVATYSDPAEILKSPKIDAVAVITPVWTHYELAKAALKTASTSSLRSRLRQARSRLRN